MKTDELLTAILQELTMLHRVICTGCLHCQPLPDPDLEASLTKVLGVGPDSTFNK